MTWTLPLHRAHRVAQGTSALLTLGLLWQLIAGVQTAPVLAAQPPVLANRWVTGSPAGVTVSLEHLAPAVVSAESGPAAPLAAGPTAPRLKLQGIIFGEHPRAYVVDESTGQTLTVRPGDQLGPITITAIHERTVVIEQEGASYELRL